MERDFSCANCDRFVCHTEHALDGPEGCPTRSGAKALERASREYRKSDVRNSPARRPSRNTNAISTCPRA